MLEPRLGSEGDAGQTCAPGGVGVDLGVVVRS
jgi:hypothetical protein